MNIKTEYEFGEMVYLIHDPEQKHRMITCFNIRPPMAIRYELTVGNIVSWHEEVEISRDKDNVKATTN
jgi:hypothetical protein